LRGYEGALIAAYECTIDEIRRSAVLDEPHDQGGRHCAPGSMHAGFPGEPELRVHGKLGTVSLWA
ncbi:unnamed protein product, partial [marine sediment metagenome]